MQVSAVATHDVNVIHPDATLQKADPSMDVLDIRPPPVSAGRQGNGILTERRCSAV